jgi:hypothetical protein
MALKSRDEMPSAHRKIHNCLITFETHNCKMINQLISANISSTAAPEWTRLMRFYYEEGSVVVRCGTAQFEYQYEF